MENIYKSGQLLTIKPIIQALAESEPELAARRLVGAVLDHHAPAGKRLPAWLIHNIGANPTRKLVAAFGEYSCFVCQGGYEICESCRGKGRLQSSLCEPCMGFGISPCKFCGGSGWVTINFVPQGLRFMVILYRIRKAREQFATISKELKKYNAGNHHTSKTHYKELATFLTRFNRIMAILENSILGFKLSCGNDSINNRQRAVWTSQCLSLAHRTDRRLRLILEELAQNEALKPDDAEFYTELSENPKLNSVTEHFFLRRELRVREKR